MAKRKAKPIGESVDEVLTRWHSELLEKIRPYLIELSDADCDSELHVILSTDGQTYCVTSELFESDGQEAIDVRRAASAIAAIDTVREGGDAVTDLYAKVTLGIRLAELRLEHLALEAEAVRDGRSTGGKNTKELTSKADILLLRAAFENHRTKKRKFEETAKELCVRHGIKSRKTGKAISARTIKTRLRELGFLENGSVRPGKR